MVYSQEDLQRIDSLVGRERITETAKLRQKKKQELQQEQVLILIEQMPMLK